METGDAVLAITIVGLEALETDVGPLLTADCRLAVAGVLRDELRVQDLAPRGTRRATASWPSSAAVTPERPAPSGHG